MTTFNDPQMHRSMDDHPRIATRHDALLISKGPPVLYHLNTERKYIDGTDEKVRWWTYGRRDRNKQNKVILMVGETAAEKTTMINTMINYLLGVKFEDEEFYQITDEEEKHEDQTQSQTSDITVYEVFVKENPTALTIIDIPGYGDTEGYEKDIKMTHYLFKLLFDEKGIHYIDAVCFVMKASQNRLSGKELYIFHSTLSLFGKDIENNIVFLLTQAAGGPPTDALNAIKTADIPCRRDEGNEPVHFLFNNQQKAKREKRYERGLKVSWEKEDKSMTEFFTFLEEQNRKSVPMTLEVLKERGRLEACFSSLVDRISEKEEKTEERKQIQEALRLNRDKIEKCENFKFTVHKDEKKQVLTKNVNVKYLICNDKATCCSVCKETCHDEQACWWAPDPSKCEIMIDGHCTVCTGKCHQDKHVKENKKYVTVKSEVTMTFDELKQEYENTDEKTVTDFDKNKYENTKKTHESDVKESENITAIERKLVNDLEKIQNEKSKLLDEAYVAIMSLSKIALKADSAFTLQHLDFLIPRLKEEGKEEWVKDLEDLKKTGEEKKNKGAVQYLMAFGQQNWNALLQK
ncbi:uncharacterized protein LOC130412237 isoform X2 [Triplophysa dalaica]|nr:uncharacterized protein LOC130412237 isoform X2 [Triplophysa dalaica]XP_056593439.1 uncharacterized protein LOC130412237 isoform X2 [Triplophysa dalaica]